MLASTIRYHYLLEQLDIKGELVTIDAAGCYTEIVDAVVENDGDYLITLKDNQSETPQKTPKRSQKNTPACEREGFFHDCSFLI